MKLFSGKTRRRSVPFHLDQQGKTAWNDRAVIASEMLKELGAAGGLVADIGCGDKKLKLAMEKIGLQVGYVGYDLNPQESDVIQFDVTKQPLPERYGFACLLGVLEYVENVRECMAGLSKQTDVLIVSHLAGDLRARDRRECELMGWKTILTIVQFEDAILDGGFAILKRRITPDGETAVWALKGMQGFHRMSKN